MFYRIFLQHSVKLMLEKQKQKQNQSLKECLRRHADYTQYVGPSERLLGICKEVQVKCPPA